MRKEEDTSEVENGRHNNFEHLPEIGKLSKFLSMSGFIISGSLMIVSIFGGSILTNLEQNSVESKGRAGIFSATLLIAAGLIFLISISLFSFSKSILESIAHPEHRVKAFRSLKTFFRLLVFALILSAACLLGQLLL